MLSGKRILVIGGSLGIGAVVAEECARAGAKVVIASRTKKDLEKTAHAIRTKTSQEVVLKVLDVSRKTDVQGTARWARKKFRFLDGLVNCAGVFGPIGRLDAIDLNEFERAHRINFLGTVYSCALFAPLMKNRSAKIVNYSGGGGTSAFPNYSAYATSKTAVVRLTENLAKEYLSLGIAVNAVAPGFVITRFHEQTLIAGDRAGKSYLENTKKEIKKGGVPPEKAARLTAFLLSNLSDGINGKLISAPWDDWENPQFINRLKLEEHFTTLRRIDGKNFAET